MKSEKGTNIESPVHSSSFSWTGRGCELLRASVAGFGVSFFQGNIGFHRADIVYALGMAESRWTNKTMHVERLSLCPVLRARAEGHSCHGSCSSSQGSQALPWSNRIACSRHGERVRVNAGGNCETARDIYVRNCWDSPWSHQQNWSKWIPESSNTTIVYTHVLNKSGHGVKSPVDLFFAGLDRSV